MSIKLKNCPQCGHETIRDFCTPQCRKEDSDNRIEAVEEERDKYKVALEEIIETKPSPVGDYPMYKSDIEMIKIVKKALK